MCEPVDIWAKTVHMELKDCSSFPSFRVLRSSGWLQTPSVAEYDLVLLILLLLPPGPGIRDVNGFTLFI